MAYRLVQRARRDVIEIWRYIADDNETAADRFIDLLTHHFRILGDNPYAGRRRDELCLGPEFPRRRILDPLPCGEAGSDHSARGAWPPRSGFVVRALAILLRPRIQQALHGIHQLAGREGLLQKRAARRQRWNRG